MSLPICDTIYNIPGGWKKMGQQLQEILFPIELPVLGKPRIFLRYTRYVIIDNAYGVGQQLF